MLLSDFSNNYLFLKFNTRVWRIHYQNIFAELAATSFVNIQGDNLVPKKYMAAHFLNFEITSNLTFGLFEAIMFSRNNQFELHYLNPLVFYRTIEGAIGSPDNVLLGVNGKWNLFNRFQLYGQFILDEFKLDELSEDGWWGNKFGIQAGIKAINIFGIDHLDGQVEFNTARPYTFTHRDSSARYTHYNQPLTHPLGANFRETVFKLRYQPFHRLVFDGRFIMMNYGTDTNTENWGHNILLSNVTREQDYGNKIGQGVATESVII